MIPEIYHEGIYPIDKLRGQIQRTYQGLTLTHLISMFGIDMSELMIKTLQPLTDEGNILFAIYDSSNLPNFPLLAKFNGHSSQSSSSLTIAVRQQDTTIDNRYWRSFRLYWSSGKDSNTPTTVMEIKKIDVLPLYGEKCSKKNSSHTTNPSSLIDEWDRRDELHTFSVSYPSEEKIAVTHKDFPNLPVIAKLQEKNTVALKVFADRKVFNTIINLVIPRKITINPDEFKKLDQLLKRSPSSF